MNSPLPLSGHRIVSTTRDDEAVDVISRSLVPVHIARLADRQHFRLDMNGCRRGRIFLMFNQFGVDTTVDAGHVRDAVIVGMGRDPRRPSYLDLGEERACASTTTATVMSPTGQIDIQRPSGSGMLGIRVATSSLLDQYEQTTGSTIKGDLGFSPSVDLTRGTGRLLCELAGELMKDLDHSDGGRGNLLREALLEDALISVILSLPGKHLSGLAEEPSRGVAPGVVRRAEEHMAAHVSDPVTLADLVAVCGCSRSALYLAFQSSRGYAPLQFLQSRRLELARARLTQDPNVSATETAIECGFGNHGRFAKAYRRRFGEAPSATLARCHGPTRH